MAKFSVWVKKEYATKVTVEIEADNEEHARRQALAMVPTVDDGAEFIYQHNYDIDAMPVEESKAA